MRLRQQGTERDRLTEELHDRTQQMEVEVFLRAREVEEANKRREDALT
jgi:hypothetical protein